MMKDPEILDRASEFVFKLFQEKLSKKLVYHTYKHTTETVHEARVLGELHQLNPEQLEILLLAAWFHDTGYVDTYEGHEENSARIAVTQLREMGYPPEKASQVADTIRAARSSDQSNELLSNILLDA
ncbi:MAG TPA: HD domain-containing protein, partial [Adhaeribacter sp.]|nr:HD domain-containing protein [Adhaeribacter sp.]